MTVLFSRPRQSRKQSQTPSAALEVPYWVDPFSEKQALTLRLSILPWLIAVICFIAWWANPIHHINLFGSILGTLICFFDVLTPAYFYAFVNRIRVVNPEIQPPPEWRIAIIVTKAPSEPWPLVRHTLVAMLAQDIPHDTWLADEDPSTETLEWCGLNNVQVSCRKGVADYHRKSWPRRTRCKEGNLAYFYDQYGYERYDFVAQLDADHVPQPDYLRQIVKPFVDTNVGYVAAPSICDNNAERSWAARGRLFAEATLHGPLQTGYNERWAPLCIGSHYAVRTRALQEIGGLGPELAEDHSTTLMMNASGWNGVFQPHAIAHGDGPETFIDCMTQEFQWSRSLMMILLQLTPKLHGSLSTRKKFQFLFSQTWYTLFSSVAIIGFLIPLACLALDNPMLRMSYVEFVAFSALISSLNFLPALILKHYGMLRPRDSRIISWEYPLFTFTRMPWVFAGIVNGVVSVVLKRELDFRVTPKGDSGKPRLPIRSLMPYALISAVSSLIVILVHNRLYTNGYYSLALASSLLMALAIVLIIFLHYLEGGHRDRASMAKALLVIACLLALATTGMVLRLGESLPPLLSSTGATTLAPASAKWSKVGNQQPSGSVGGPLDGPLDAHCSLKPCFGYYDNDRTLSQEEVPSDITHHFIPWGEKYVETIRSALASDKAAGVKTLLTLEPWPWAILETGDPATYKQREARLKKSLVSDIVNGNYDSPIVASLDSIAEGAGDGVVVVRLMHEMEIKDQYPWSTTSPESYIQAYRHVVDLSRKRGIHNIRWMWSPAGFNRAASFWPGDRYVDYVGLSLYATPEWNGGLAPKGVNASLDSLLKSRYWVRQYHKPIVLAEVGINGPASEKRHWFQQALKALPYYPEVVAWIYFNQQQPPIVPLEIGLPNWGLTIQEARDLRKVLLSTPL